MDNNLPITVLSWIIAILPLVALFIMLLGLRWSSAKAGTISLLLAIGTAMLVFDTPLQTTFVGMGKGLWDAFGILLIVWAALLFYHVNLEAGAYTAIRDEIRKVSENRLFLVLAFGWVFAGFLQGIVGFGAPIAIVAPLLVGLGVKPIYAVAIPLIGHIWSNVFGTIGTSWTALNSVVTLDNPVVTAFLTAILLWVTNLTAGVMIAWLFGRGKAIKESWLFIVVVSLIQGGGQVLLSLFIPTLSAFIPGAISMVAVFLFPRLEQYRTHTELEKDSTILLDENADTEGVDKEPDRADLELSESFMPYIVLTILTVIGLGIPTVNDFLSQFSFGFSFPTVSTGYDFTTAGTPAYAPLAIFTNASFYILLATIFAWFWFKSKGAYEDRSLSDVWNGFKEDALGTTGSIIVFLMMSQILQHSGQNTVLALGIATVSPPVVYAALSSWIGHLGAFMTSSTTSSNILFGPLQANVVSTMQGLSLGEVMAAQAAGSAVGNVAAPANILLGTGTVGGDDQISEIYKPTITYAAITGIIISIISVIVYYLI